MTIQLPKYKIALYITHNEYKVYYQTIEEFCNEFDNCDWRSPEEKQKAIDTGSVWTVRWYPHTPVGFLEAAGATLEEAIQLALEMEKDYKDAQM